MKDEFYYKKDRLGQIRGFCAMVQNNCSVTKAAEQLGLERPAVSKQLSSLERDLAIPIFDRNNVRKLSLTKEGLEFYDLVMPALQKIEYAFQNFKKNIENKKNNTIRIAAFDLIIKKILPYIAEYKDKNINFLLFNLSKEEAFEKLVKDEIDIAIYPEDQNEKEKNSIKREEISENISYLVLYPGHPLASKRANKITKKDIITCGGVISSGFIYSKDFKDFIDKNTDRACSNIEKTINPEILKEMVRNKMGIAFIDDFWFSKSEKKNFILKKDYIFQPMYFYSFYKNNKKQGMVIENFLGIIKKNHNKIFH